MPLIDVDDVQVWLEETKLNLDQGDELLEEPFQSEIVLARLGACEIDTSLWVDIATTPAMIRGIIGMLVAAQRYNKVYSESEDGGNPYADKLQEMANVLLMGICMGTLDVTGIPDSPASLNQGTPVFYPMDNTGLLDEDDGAGIKFTMGMRF